MKELSKQANDVMEGAEETLSEREFAGCDTSWGRAHLYEAEWRINCTNDYKAASDAVARLRRALDRKDPPDGLTQDCGGSFAPGTEVFFLKLDRSTDQLLARQWPWRLQPTFLDRIDDPGRMVTYLQDLCWSDVTRCGSERHIQFLNAATNRQDRQTASNRLADQRQRRRVALRIVTNLTVERLAAIMAGMNV